MNTRENRLDREHKGRISELATAYSKGKLPSVSDVLSSQPVARSFEGSKLLLPSYNPQRILLSYPFSKEIYVPICPKCVKNHDLDDLKQFLDHHAIVPILIGEYGEYPEPILKVVLPHPHISIHEVMFLRYVMLTAEADGAVCSHCIEMRRKEYSDIVKAQIGGGNEDLLDKLFHNLHPFIKPDYELLDAFGHALRKNDLDAMNNIQSVSTAVWDARTCQALNARSLVPARAIPRLIEESRPAGNKISDRDVELIESALAQDIQLQLPNKVRIDTFLRCVEPYRGELSTIADSLVSESIAAQKGELTRLNSRLAELHEDIRRLSHHKGYLTYRAVWGFTKTNKALLGSMLLASAYGLSGNFLGCGIGVAGAAGSHVAKKLNKLKMPQEMTELVDEVKHSIRPHIHKLISMYLGIDVRAIQLFEINEVLNKNLGKAGTPTSDSTRIASPRRARKR